ncbi:PREDICTED: vitelline membrane outer layer protein 1-like [Gekko japonicus]|uniref:Vitelline membrane outer layer protein 1-like n=1 Tax=Gekko japonicus TaxID=146911 RepID=A0ABM1JN21_GEKJA|nr:PREDICTED: vitelline membrane outer layer protein 1-like [Gekko japonicus]
MQLTSPTVFFLLLSCCLWDVESKNVASVISVTNGGQWGEWGERKVCRTSEAKGFSLKVQLGQGSFSDDTSLNGIRLICTDDSVITSAVGKYGTWLDAHYCPSGFLASFSLRVSKERLFDNMAANNIKFKCTDGSELEGNGLAWGEYGKWSKSCEEAGICGIQTKVDTHKGIFSLDNTGLNDVKFFCCT